LEVDVGCWRKLTGKQMKGNLWPCGEMQGKCGESGVTGVASSARDVTMIPKVDVKFNVGQEGFLSIGNDEIESLCSLNKRLNRYVKKYVGEEGSLTPHSYLTCHCRGGPSSCNERVKL
jgi:hypothetical protein